MNSGIISSHFLTAAVSVQVMGVLTSLPAKEIY
jgi:hypothetical protein